MPQVLPEEQWPTVPGYNLLETYPLGGYGAVFKAQEISPIGSIRAIKVCWPSPLSTTEHDAENRFLREISILQSLNHPGIARYWHAGYTEGDDKKPFFVQDFIEGNPLSEYCGNIDTHTAVKYIIEVLKTLEHCHAQGISHRDIKPNNVMIRSSDKYPILIDFGLSISAEHLNSRITASTAPGTIYFLSPERVENPELVDNRIDVFQVSATLVNLLSGSFLPQDRIREVFTQIDKSNAQLVEILIKGLAPIEQRHHSAEEMRTTLERWLKNSLARTSISTSLSEQAKKIRETLSQKQQQSTEMKKAREEEKMRIAELFFAHTEPMLLAIWKVLRELPLACEGLPGEPKLVLGQRIEELSIQEFLDESIEKNQGNLFLLETHGGEGVIALKAELEPHKQSGITDGPLFSKQRIISRKQALVVDRHDMAKLKPFFVFHISKRPTHLAGTVIGVIVLVGDAEEAKNIKTVQYALQKRVQSIEGKNLVFTQSCEDVERFTWSIIRYLLGA